MMNLNEAMAALNLNVSIKFALGVSLFANAILSLGTERHLPLYKAAWDGEVKFRIVASTVVGFSTGRIVLEVVSLPFEWAIHVRSDIMKIM
jgi:hypothetical protein